MASTYTNMSTSSMGGHTVASEDVVAELRQLDEEIHNAYGSFSNSSLSIGEDDGDRDIINDGVVVEEVQDEVPEVEKERPVPTHEPQEPTQRQNLVEEDDAVPDPLAETRRVTYSEPPQQQPIRPYEGNVEVRIQQAEAQLRTIQAKLGESAEVLKEVNRAVGMAADNRRESFDELEYAVRLISEVSWTFCVFRQQNQRKINVPPRSVFFRFFWLLLCSC